MFGDQESKAPTHQLPPILLHSLNATEEASATAVRASQLQDGVGQGKYPGYSSRRCGVLAANCRRAATDCPSNRAAISCAHFGDCRRFFPCHGQFLPTMG